MSSIEATKVTTITTLNAFVSGLAGAVFASSIFDQFIGPSMLEFDGLGAVVENRFWVELSINTILSVLFFVILQKSAGFNTQTKKSS